MPATIHIDDEVQASLANLAIQRGLDVFSPDTPNKILRIELGVEQSAPMPLPPAPQVPEQTTPRRLNPQPSQRTHQRIGPRLLREHGLDCEKGYFSKTGNAYTYPNDFPAVFFDPDGYLVIKDEASMQINPHINAGKQVSIPRGLRPIPGYVLCGHRHS